MLGRRYLVGGNWKCNGTKDSVLKLVKTLNSITFDLKKVGMYRSWSIPRDLTVSLLDVVVAPISFHIPLVQ